MNVKMAFVANCMNRALLQKLIVAQLIKKFFAVSGALFTTARHRTLSYTSEFTPHTHAFS
jgi:hypothetical protein